MKFIKWIFSSISNIWIPFYFGLMITIITAVIVNPVQNLGIGTTPIFIIVLLGATVVGGSTLAIKLMIDDYKASQNP